MAKVRKLLNFKPDSDKREKQQSITEVNARVKQTEMDWTTKKNKLKKH